MTHDEVTFCGVECEENEQQVGNACQPTRKQPMCENVLSQLRRTIAVVLYIIIDVMTLVNNLSSPEKQSYDRK